MFEKDLISLGLSEKEARIYIVLLELEVATAHEVAEKSGVNRSSAYVVLEKMKEKGIVGLVETENIQRIKGSVTFFRSTSWINS